MLFLPSFYFPDWRGGWEMVTPGLRALSLLLLHEGNLAFVYNRLALTIWCPSSLPYYNFCPLLTLLLFSPLSLPLYFFLAQTLLLLNATLLSLQTGTRLPEGKSGWKSLWWIARAINGLPRKFLDPKLSPSVLSCSPVFSFLTVFISWAISTYTLGAPA